MPEVYRVMFEAFGMDPDDESCQPKLRRQLEDVDYVSAEFETRQLSWQDVAAYRVSLIICVVLVSEPLLFIFAMINSFTYPLFCDYSFDPYL
jgi:hypothetical protein